MKLKHILFIVVVAALASRPLYAQGALPQWVAESYRSSAYPFGEWYSGFAQDVLTGGESVADAIKRMERSAQNQLVESIAVRLSGDATSRSTARSVQQGKNFDEKIEGHYKEVIRTSASANVTNMETRSHYDHQRNRVYAFAAVKRVDLANYYASQISTALNEAQRNLDLARQMLANGNKREANAALAKSLNHIDAVDSYRLPLVTVDPRTGHARSEPDRENAIRQAIAALRSGAKHTMAVYVTGTENMHGQKTDIIMSGLMTLLSENDYATTENRDEAGYIISIEANVCNARASESFHYASACVKVTLHNAHTNKREHFKSITGRKEGGRNERNAAEKAFRSVVPQVWDAVKGSI